MTTLHAGGKFNNRSYAVSAGLHGVGRVGGERARALVPGGRAQARPGVPPSPTGGACRTPRVAVAGTTDRTGTVTAFLADDEIFETIEYSFDRLTARLRELAFLNKGIRITLVDRRSEPHREHEFEFAGGVKQFIEYLNANKQPIHPAAAVLRGYPRQCRRGGVAGLQQRLF